MKEKTKDIDYILENFVGTNGLWQWWIIFLIYPIGIASGLPWLMHLFAAYEPDFRCFIPGINLFLESY